MNMKMSAVLRKIYLSPVFFYRRFISPGLPNSCRYTPTCSSYFIQAVEKHGIIKGTILGTSRLCRCNGYFKTGDDPVPEVFRFKGIREDYRNFRTKTLRKK